MVDGALSPVIHTGLRAPSTIQDDLVLGVDFRDSIEMRDHKKTQTSDELRNQMVVPNAQRPTPVDQISQANPSFWDSFSALVLLVLAILLGRFYILEPFKIPSGSMEPTLFGHEDYGDRIVTNKLAYVPWDRVLWVMAGALLLILIGFIASKAWKRTSAWIVSILITLGTVGGIGFAWARGAIASELPHRFDVVVFEYNSEWEHPKASNKKINYIKRLVGLPNETLVISGGDLFRRNKKINKDEMIRKWQEGGAALQDSLWYPVSKAWMEPIPKDASKEDQERLAFPWSGVEPGVPGVRLETQSLLLDGSAPVELTYRFPVTNIYLKQGRWPFIHNGCPAVSNNDIKTKDGAIFRNPDAKSENVTAYVANTWEGVQCQNCKQIMFPISTDTSQKPCLEPQQNMRFFYGGDQVVGDLKIELDIELATDGGTIEIEVGSNLHRAMWKLPSSAIPDSVNPGMDSDPTRHNFSAPGQNLSAGKHRLSLAYVDATVIARFDGHELDPLLISVEPPGKAAYSKNSLARVRFQGVKGVLTRLDLFRDLYHTASLRSYIPMDGPPDQNARQQIQRWYENGNYVVKLFSNEFLMLGDNAPSSSDGRVWGNVPRENLSGRAAFVWWPPSRWRVIR